MSVGARYHVLAATLLATLASQAGAAGGTITGRVDVTPAKFLDETVVFLKDGPAVGAPRTLNMDQKNMTFVPHLLVIAAGDTVNFLNHDNLVHNVYSPDGDAFNLGAFKQDERRSHTFAKPGAYAQLCSVHPEMLGYVFVAPGPHAVAVDKKGAFTLSNVPPGTHTLAVWNAHLEGPEQQVTVADGQTLKVSLAVKR